MLSLPTEGLAKAYVISHRYLFENSNLPLEKIIRIIHMWSTVTPLDKMRKELDVSCNTRVLVHTCIYIYNALLIYLYVQADRFIYNAPFADLAENSRSLEMCVQNIFNGILL